MIELLRVEIDGVSSSHSRSNFSEADLDLIADRILESGGILKPLVLKKIGFEKYEVIDGHFEYYAAVRASEKNPHAAEVNALIISPESEQAGIKQIETFKNLSSNQPSETLSQPTNYESRIANLELRIEKQSNEFRSELTTEIKKLDDKLKNFESQFKKKVKPLDLLNTLKQDELEVQLQRSRIPKHEKIAKAIVEARQKNPQQTFNDYRDVVKSVNGLGEKTMLIIVDTWS